MAFLHDTHVADQAAQQRQSYLCHMCTAPSRFCHTKSTAAAQLRHIAATALNKHNTSHRHGAVHNTPSQVHCSMVAILTNKPTTCFALPPTSLAWLTGLWQGWACRGPCPATGHHQPHYRCCESLNTVWCMTCGQNTCSSSSMGRPVCSRTWTFNQYMCKQSASPRDVCPAWSCPT
jgi:hypothetical protein